MNTWEIIFWSCAALVAYTFVGYPLLLWTWNRLRGNAAEPVRGENSSSLSIVLAVHNEQQRLSRRLRELVDLLHASGRTGEVIVVSDGSTDATADIARSFAGEGVRLVEIADNVGKAAALSEGCRQATGDILVFADARQRWAPDALARLVSNFADRRVGAVSGDLVLETAPGVLAGVGLYWRVEKWLRKQESRAYAMVGVTGAMCAVRRELFRPIPPGTVLDDVYWPLQVAMQGYRVIHDERALAYDRLPEKTGDEFRRKVRTLSGNFQLLTRLPGALLPWRNPIWLQFVSHKLLRLVAPWALVGLFTASIFLPEVPYQAAMWSQIAGYALALAGLCGMRLPLAGAAASFLVLNAAAWLAFWVWIGGRTERSWKKVRYDDKGAAPLHDAEAVSLASASGSVRQT